MDTSLGGKQSDFTRTDWSAFLAAPDRAEMLNRLFTKYWRPVYAFIRSVEGRPVEELKDLTQSFFQYLLERGVVSNYEKRKGKFRHFLKGTIRNFLSEARKKRWAKKRGGGEVFFSIESCGFEEEISDETPNQSMPEEIFDREWAAALLRRSLKEVREELRRESKDSHLQVYDLFERGERDETPPTHAEIAAALGLTPRHVKYCLQYVRQRIMKQMEQEIFNTVSTRQDFFEEMSELLSR